MAVPSGPLHWRIVEGDALERLHDLPAESVQTCVTSPPYWGLRDYGTAAWEGGDEECDHLGPLGMSDSTTLRRDRPSRPAQGFYDGEQKREARRPYKHVCGKCGAARIDSQLGLEPTPDCGTRGYFRLRSDLTEDQREYVARRLAGVESPDA